MATKSEIRSDVRAVLKGQTIFRDNSFLTRIEDSYVMVTTRNGRWERHTLYVGATDANRLAAHWAGFLPA